MIGLAQQLDPSSGILELWADLYRRGAFSTSVVPGSWQAADELLRAVTAADRLARGDLANSVVISNQTFLPLGDPLTIDFGAHRWLSSEREEAYSDWLEWILKQIADVRRILKLFGVKDENLLAECDSEEPTIKREVPILGGAGRLDLTVACGNRVLVIAEIKTKWFDKNDVRTQLTRYIQWVRKQPQSMRCYFVAVESVEFDCPTGFEPLPWRELSLRLRELAREWIQASKNEPTGGGDLVHAAMTLAFCGAVEQKLLGLSGKPVTFKSQPSAEYLKDWIARSGGQTDDAK